MSLNMQTASWWAEGKGGPESIPVLLLAWNPYLPEQRLTAPVPSAVPEAGPPPLAALGSAGH